MVRTARGDLVVSGFRVTPGDLHREAGVFERLGRDLTTALDTLQSALTCRGNATGCDDPGSTISARCDDNTAKVARTTSNLAERAARISRGIDVMSGTYTGTDRTCAGVLDRGVQP